MGDNDHFFEVRTLSDGRKTFKTSNDEHGLDMDHSPASWQQQILRVLEEERLLMRIFI